MVRLARLLGLSLVALFFFGSCDNLLGPTKSSATLFTVTFDSNGGTPVASLTGLAGGTKIGAAPNPTKHSFAFTGWYREAGLVTPWNFATDTVEADTTLYALWTATGTAGITIAPPSTGSISFSGQTLVLTQGATLTLTATVVGTVQSYAWYLDGVADSTQTTATWAGGSNLPPGPHGLMLVAKVQGVLYSKSLYFTVQ